MYLLHAIWCVQYSTGVLAGDQLLGTSLLLIIICAVTDSRNLRISPSLVPLYIGLGLSAIHLG
jgi:glycerol uptake facilitator-like aquaporin